MSALTIKPGTGYGFYDLYRADGTKVGEVFKIVTSYNIAPRPITVTSWRYSLHGLGPCATKFARRRDAVAAAAERVPA